jgi:serine/threonine protein kinase
MADDSPLALSNTLIAGRYAVDTSQVMLDAGGGIPAYLARDRLAADGKRVALAVSRDASPRATTLKTLLDPIENLMVPLGHGGAPLPGGKGAGYFIVCSPPPGPPVSASLRPWPERALVDLVLRPVARVLDVLHSNKLTHRAIRPNNVFEAAPGQPVTLGAAWAAPPAMHQPAVFESAESAMCHPAGRGDGTIADDVYSLGVLMLSLLGGKIPMANMDDPTIIRWKLDLGSFAALTRDIAVSGSLAELLRGMLAEDPDHRPLPAALLDPTNLRGRRIAARPNRRSQRPLMLNEIAVFDGRLLAYALYSDQKKAIQFLRNGQVTQWLRRGLGDAGVAAQIEEVVRAHASDTGPGPRGDALMLMQTIAAISPHMPLCWRGVALWPDSLPSILAEGIAGRGDLLVAAEELLTNDIASTWSSTTSHRKRPGPPDIHSHRSQGSSPSILLRLYYGLNPLLPCGSPAMTAGWVTTLPDLLHFLERVCTNVGDGLIDLHVSAFIASRADRKLEIQVNSLIGSKDAESFRLGEIALLRDLQARYHPGPMPQLAQWVAARLRPDIDRWHNKSRREAMQARLDALVQQGLLSRLLELTNDPAARMLDTAEAQQAEYELATIDSELAAIESSGKLRFADAERYGRAMTGGLGLTVLILMVMSVVLG